MSEQRSIVVLSAVLALVAISPSAHAAAGADTGLNVGYEPVDLQAHRGGLGLVVENTLPAFANALEVGVSTLELDVQITQDGRAVLTHDRQVAGDVCQDTGPAFAADPEYPYVGDYITDLTLEQVWTLDCGSLTLPSHPRQRPAPGARMPLLSQVFDLVKRYAARHVWFNIETKVEAAAPSETAPRGQFVAVVAREIRQAGMLERVTIQSFDWGALMLMRKIQPRLPIVALSTPSFLEVGRPGASPWLGGIDIDDYDGSLVAAADSFGADAISPVHGFGQVGRSDYRPFTTLEMVTAAHQAGMEVVPYTVDDLPTMAAMLDIGVDGLITNYPDRLRALMDRRGYPLPPKVPAAT